MTLEKLIDKCDMYRSLYQSAHPFRKQEYYDQWQYYKGLLTEHAKNNGYKVKLYFKPPTIKSIPMHDWNERFEEYGS
jgi:hypothetical protein